MSRRRPPITAQTGSEKFRSIQRANALQEYFDEIQSDLRAHLPLNEGTGSIAFDTTGGFDGVLAGNTAWTQSHTVFGGSSVRFLDPTGYILIPKFSAFRPSTMSFWVYLETNLAEGDKAFFLGRWNRAWGTTLSVERLAGNVDRWNLGFGGADLGTVDAPTDATFFSDAWKNIVLVFEDSSDIHLYLDGDFIHTFTGAPETEWEARLVLGAHLTVSNPGEFGLNSVCMNDFRAFQTAKSAEQVKRLWEATFQVTAMASAGHFLSGRIRESVVKLVGKFSNAKVDPPVVSIIRSVVQTATSVNLSLKVYDSTYPSVKTFALPYTDAEPSNETVLNTGTVVESTNLTDSDNDVVLPLTGLTPSTAYRVKILSENAAKARAIVDQTDALFSTPAVSETFHATGSVQTWTASFTGVAWFRCVGGEGGGGVGSAAPGKGGSIEVRRFVTEGQTYDVYVGSRGDDYDAHSPDTGGGLGGGGSGVSLSGTMLVVAGGGGGAGSSSTQHGGNGGHALGPEGDTGNQVSSTWGLGGTDTAPGGSTGSVQVGSSGSGRNGGAGSFDNGQAGTLAPYGAGSGGVVGYRNVGYGGGGGGGGWFGGGGGGTGSGNVGGGGGGGSSHYNTGDADLVSVVRGPVGLQSGDGYVQIFSESFSSSYSYDLSKSAGATALAKTNFTALPTAALTVNLWARCRTSTFTSFGWFFHVDDAVSLGPTSDFDVEFKLVTDGGTFVATVTLSDQDTRPDVWNMYTLTYDGSGAKAYLNGAEVGAQALAGSVSYTNKDLMIGRDPAGASAAYRGDGWLDEMAVWSAGLDAANVAALYGEGYNVGKPINPRVDDLSYDSAASLFAWWSFENAAEVDDSEHGHTLSVVGEPPLQSRLVPTNEPSVPYITVDETFHYTGGVQTWTATSTRVVEVTCVGASGGQSRSLGTLSGTDYVGRGGSIKAYVPVINGTTYSIWVGGQGANAEVASTTGAGGAGGGGSAFGLGVDVIVAAGGGGGAGAGPSNTFYAGGDGGTTGNGEGENAIGPVTAAAGGGTAEAGGTSTGGTNQASSGSAVTGGAGYTSGGDSVAGGFGKGTGGTGGDEFSASFGGGGGGGGYFGGAGGGVDTNGHSCGGGGGSSHYNLRLASLSARGPESLQLGDGYVRIEARGPPNYCFGSPSSLNGSNIASTSNLPLTTCSGNYWSVAWWQWDAAQVFNVLWSWDGYYMSSIPNERWFVYYPFGNAIVHAPNHSFGTQRWHFLVLVYDNGTFKQYTDGVLVNTEVRTAPARSGTGMSINTNGSAVLTYIDDIFMINRALTTGEVVEIYNAGVPLDVKVWASQNGYASDLKHYWKFDLNGQDSVGSAHLTLTNSDPTDPLFFEIPYP
jgi:hypothetical protein